LSGGKPPFPTCNYFSLSYANEVDRPVLHVDQLSPNDQI